MYLKSKMRLLGMSALVGAGLVAATSANAYNVRLGEVDIQIDTTASIGLSVRVEDRETDLLPSVNGGPTDTRAVRNLNGLASAGTEGNLDSVCYDNGSICAAEGNLASNANYDSSINTDDSRLNFDNGDLTGGTLKFSSDIEGRMGDFTAFARVTGFYDAVMDSDSSFERGSLTDDADSDSVMHIDLLDAYVDWDGQVLGNPLLVRVGKQVINWGESTFVLGGNSVFSPIDVGAFVRPGAEIKEALLPVEAIYASMSLPYDLSVEAYYGGHEEFKLPRSGTPFSNSDSFTKGSSNAGGYFIGGATSSGAARLNCDTTGASAQTVALSTALLGAIANKNAGINCTDTPGLDFTYQLGSGSDTPEMERKAYEDSYFNTRDTSRDPGGKNDSYGLAVRWYSEALNSTEFGFYYQNYRSRIPYASVVTTGPTLGYSVVGASASRSTRSVNAIGCAGLLGAYAGNSLTSTVALRAAGAATVADLGIKVKDPLNLLEAENATQLSGINSVITAGAVGNYTLSKNSDGYLDLATAQAAACQTILQADHQLTTLDPNQSDTNYSWVMANAALAAGGDAATEAAYNGLNAAATAYGWNGTASTGHTAKTGEMYLAVGFPNHLVAEYPEEIEVYGLSAATTFLGWGVQGEIAYRPDMPLQRDADSVVIGGLVAGCAFRNYGALGGNFAGLAELAVADGLSCTDEETLVSGVNKDYDVLNWDIGTTATFTRSNPVIAALGADIGILLTEFAGVTVTDTDLKTIGRAADGSALAGRCTSGSDLALRSVFGLDPRGQDECRPTRSAWGYVLFGQLQYNNVFGSAMALKPTIAYTAGAEGRAVAPAAGWVEDQSRLGLSVQAELQGKWSGSLGYTMYDGDVLYNRNIDKDFVSLSVSYAY
jgi:hypothetical protein